MKLVCAWCLTLMAIVLQIKHQSFFHQTKEKQFYSGIQVKFDHL